MPQCKSISQLSIFHNFLRPETKMIIYAAIGGTMMIVDAKQATKFIDVLNSIDYQAHHDISIRNKK